MSTDHAAWTGYHVNLDHRPDPDTAPADELVVALDGSVFAERSLEVADALAAAADLPLRLVAVPQSAAEISSTASYLARVARRVPRVTDMTVDTTTTDVGGALATAAGDGALVVLATHARRAVANILFGSVADRACRSATDRCSWLVRMRACRTRCSPPW